MDNFNKYSKYYDLLYADKKYDVEANYISSIITNYQPNCKKILELGSGSGNHAFFFSKMGFEVHGIELSEDMVQLSKRKNILNFHPRAGNIIDFKISQKFDVAISLFHVISYLNDNKSLVSCFNTVNKHLNLGGIFIFDVWYSPAVFTQKPETKIKRLENKEISVIRIAESFSNMIKNLVEVSFEVIIKNKSDNKSEIINEIHSMRHFSVLELELLAELAGFQLIFTEEFVSKNIPSEKTWGVCVMFKKVRNLL